jgi:dynein heavy chain 1, cytosolic
MGGDKSTLDPERLPWDAIRSTLCKGVFGGRVTNPLDQDVLDKLVNTVFVSKAYDLNFRLVPELLESPVLPEGSSKEDCIEWIGSLAEHTPPTWLGLGADAEKELEARRAESIKAKVKRIFEKEDHE